MTRVEYAFLALVLAAAPAHAVTNAEGDILISPSAVASGGITPGDGAGFPVTITVPGTYRLTGNLTVTGAVNGIEVKANDVSIEMGGHTLAGGGVGRNGITSFNRATRVNGGNVRGFTNDGVRSIGPALTISNMIISANGRKGVYAQRASDFDYASAYFARISGSTITGNGDDGVACGDYCVVEGSNISTNTNFGVSITGEGGVVLGNAISKNGVGVFFGATGGAGNNTVVSNPNDNFRGTFTQMQPNACYPACPP